MDLWASVPHCPKLSCALPSIEQLKYGGWGSQQLDSRFMCAAVVELHLRAGNHLAGLLWVQSKLHAGPVWHTEGGEIQREEGGGDEKEVWERDKKDGWEMENQRAKKSRSKRKKKLLILLSHFCKEPPGVCVSAGGYCCCREKTFRQKLQLRDYWLALRKLYGT